jgi:hypothetical protein
MVGIRGFLGREGREFELDGLRSIGKAREALSPGNKQNIRERHEKDLRGIDVAHLPDCSQNVSAASYHFVKAIQDRLDGHLIRRTIDSTKPDGTKINDQLPPMIRHPIAIVLPEHEMLALHCELRQKEDEYVTLAHHVIILINFSAIQ